ncbi:MAG: hypothetical protein E6Q97_38565 [Desulfurellales bacterium]|nr:MAG: hypothetical protein E6Q97_38565 [Desulfurellales bacterium]
MISLAIALAILSLAGALFGVIDAAATSTGYTRRQRRNLRKLRADIRPALQRVPKHEVSK